MRAQARRGAQTGNTAGPSAAEIKEVEASYDRGRVALNAFFASPFRSALVVSADGGGNDGCFSAYRGAYDRLARVARVDVNLGSMCASSECVLSPSRRLSPFARARARARAVA